MPTQFSNVADCLRKEGLRTLNRWREDTLERGYPEHYGELEPFDGRTQTMPEPRDAWYVPELCCGSDYSGCLVHRSNADAMMEIARQAEADGDLAPNTVVEVYGGHGTYAVAIRGDVECEAIIEALCALADYPLLDEDRHAQLECDAQDMAWDNGGFGLRRDFARALEKRAAEIEGAADDPDEPEIDLASPAVRAAVDALFWDARERANEEWTNEQGCECWIDIDPIVDEVTDEEIAEILAIA